MGSDLVGAYGSSPLLLRFAESASSVLLTFCHLRIRLSVHCWSLSLWCRMCAVVSVVVTVLEAVAARCALPALFYVCEVTEDGAVLAGVELELPAAGGAVGPRREFFWSVVWHSCLDAYDQAAVQAIRFLQSIYGFVVRDYNYDWDGFFPIFSSEVVTGNRKRRKIILDRLRGRIPDAPFTSPLEPSWVGFTLEETDILKASYRDRSFYGGPGYQCGRCKASLWYQERVKAASAITERRVVYNNCCKGGKVFIAPFRRPPEFLQALLHFDGPVRTKKFIDKIRQYNCLFAFTSMGATIDRSVNSGGGPNVFKICGAVCHRIGSLLPVEGETPKYAELYIYHGGYEADNRIQALNKDDKAEGGLDKDIVKGLEIMLNAHNSLVKQFRMAKQVLAENEFADVSIRIVAPGELDGPQFNLPSTDELACLVFGEVTLEAPKRDIIIRCRGSGLQRISSLHPAYMSLQYPLLFPYVLHTVEFQKRGLPHAHILVWQDKEKRGEVTPALIDSFISAEIPDPVEDPLGYALVDEFMMHGPCGEHNPKCPCMKDGVCSKKFPKSFQDETSVDEAGFLVYRHRNNGRFVMKNKVNLDNRHVVPYNMTLLKIFQAHLNVEWCNKTHVIKYLYKYVTKGPDFSKTLFERIKNTGDPEDDDIDEIEEYRTCRYICANDSFWRCYGFDIHSKHPSVERLVVHLLGKHVVRFRALANLPALVNNSLLQKTMLTEWFVANARHASARSLTYCDFPTRWSWVAESKKWVRRKRSDKIGRVYYVHPSTGELYYLRMLLMLVKGAKCYADVRTYNGTVYGSFKDACTARGLLGDDTEWYYAFDEALEWGMGNQLRQLFVAMILYCGVLDENVFFEKYWTYLAEDIQYRIRSSLHDASYTVPVDELRNMLLDELAVVFAKNGSSISNHALPLKTVDANDLIVNNMVSDELSQDCETLIKTAETMQQQLNEDQKVAFKTIVGKVRDGKPGFFFVSGQGGTGKTFLWNAMVAYLRGYKRIVLTVASSGVASLLLPGGRTAHSRFKIPIDLENDGVCDIRRGTMLCSLIEAASLIIWDEALMTHRKCFEALDRSLRDVLSANDPLLAELPFGGKVVVLGGDLRQILPVIEGGTRSQVVDAAITNSPLWGHIIVLPLTINQRLAVQTANDVVQAEAAAFAEWVLNIGDGTIPAVARQGESSPTWITIPDEYLVHTEGDKIAAIVESVYVDFLTRYSDPNYLKERAILTPTNDIAEDINKHVLSMVPGEEREYLSCDSTGNAADGIRNMAVNLLSEIHSRSNQWTISVLISRMWHYRGGTDEGPLQHTDVVLIDQEGNHMYDELPPATSERLKDVLEEGKVFIIRKFMCNDSKPSFRPVESLFMVQFTRYTTVQEMPALVDTYPFCTYSLTSFADIPAAVSRPARFVDVIGKIEMVSDIVPVQSIYQTAPSNTRTIILKDQLGNELRLVLWGERALEFDAEAVRAMGVNEPVIAIFVGTLTKMSHGVKSLSGGSACRWYIDEDIPDINLFRESLGPQFVPLAAYVPTGPGAIVPRVFEAPTEKTTQELNDVDPFVDMEKKFLCTVKVDRLGADQRWWFASCSVCRKSARHDGYQFQCSGKDCASIDASLAYCVSFFASDAMGETEFVMFEKVAAGAIGKQLLPLMWQRYPGYTTVGELAQAAKRDTSIPLEIERLIGQKYKLLVSISKRWNSGNSENLCYQVCRIEETYKPELPPLTFSASPGASSSSGGLGATLPPLGPSQSPMQSASPALGSHLSQVTRSAATTPPPRVPVTPARGSSAPKRGARHSLFTSPSKDKSQVGEDDPLAADGDLLLGEETITEPLVETASANAIVVDSDKANRTVIPKTKRNASSTKSGGLAKKLKP
ncbi:hypothetical protein ACQ4PT_064970 [Festuca glaucescens]